MARYGRYIKNNPGSSTIIEGELNKREAEFRNDDEFREIEADGREMEALAEFRRSCGFGKFISERKASKLSRNKKLSLSKPRMSTGSSVSSIQSKRSKESSLDPIEEEDEGTKETGFELTSPESQGASRSHRYAQGSAASTIGNDSVDGDGPSVTGASKLKTKYNDDESNTASPQSRIPQSDDDETIVSSPRSKVMSEDTNMLRSSSIASNAISVDNRKASNTRRAGNTVDNPVSPKSDSIIASPQSKKSSSQSGDDETVAAPVKGRSSSSRRSTQVSESKSLLESSSVANDSSSADYTNNISIRPSGNTLGTPPDSIDSD